MYKKLLFLMIAMPLTHSNVYSMNNLDQAAYSFSRTAALGTMLATPILLSKEPSTAKEAALPLLTAVFVASGIAMITNPLSRIAGYMTSENWPNLKNFLSSPKLNIAIGSIAGLVFYHEKGHLFK